VDKIARNEERATQVAGVEERERKGSSAA